jgi:drug/metabolite transporter (DMT)-like permease
MNTETRPGPPASDDRIPWPLWTSIGYVAVVLIWSTTWYGIHTQVNGTSPHIGVALRMGAAALIFAGIAVLVKQRLRVPRRQIGPILVQGVCFFGFNYLTVYSGAQYLTSGVVAVIVSLAVPLNIVAEWTLYGVRPKLLTVIAAVLGMIGISLVFGSELENALAVQGAWWGAGLVACSAIFVAIGNVISVRLMHAKLSWVAVNALGMAVGTVAVLLWGVVSGANWVLEPSPVWLGGFAYLVLIGSVAAFGIYMKILPTIGTTAGAYVTVLCPVVALLISALLEGFRLQLLTFAGVALLLFGHTLLIRQRSGRTPR